MTNIRQLIPSTPPGAVATAATVPEPVSTDVPLGRSRYATPRHRLRRATIVAGAGAALLLELTNPVVLTLVPAMGMGKTVSVGSAAAGCGRKTTRPAKQTSNGGSTQQIREWANANGYTVSARGRIAADIMEAYTAAH
ncbi:Lsr2 family DNA-binding protein [Prescottella agglutinans]|uniref:Lsr2 DNA-binding domain-containing protein n=1 Tax=Prescottella agglutinans TaxID=1644129 RepID=A0ABT6MML7_9NOCA|nr:histone-like nucleoid-structuring protein Lsr2 [Prescottella agglutinans]MDH6284844.1 hypothetical protein [Prescottella agglutinans]